MSACSRILTLGTIAAVLAGCATSGQTTADLAPEMAAAVDVPPTYRADVVKAMRLVLKDPESVRDAEISTPTRGFVGLVHGGTASVVCVRMNAKNSFGGYTGIQASALIFRAGKIVDMIQQQPIACADAAYGPFPEMTARPVS